MLLVRIPAQLFVGFVDHPDGHGALAELALEGRCVRSQPIGRIGSSEPGFVPSPMAHVS